MKHSKLKTAIMIALTTASLNIGIANSTGIPVVDVASIVQLIEQLNAMKQQYEELQSQTENLETQIANTIGSRGLGDILNNPAIKAALPEDWNSIYGAIKSTNEYKNARAALPSTTNPTMSAYYDKKAADSAAMSTLFNKTSKRLKQVQDLMGQIDSAEDPAAKQDLTNRLVSEQNAIVATSQLVELMKEKQKQDEEVMLMNLRVQSHCKEFKKPGC